MRFGVVFPQIELAGRVDDVRHFAQAVELLGYDHLLAYDHVMGAAPADREPPLTGPYTDADPFHDPFALLSYLAGITDRMELVTAVLVLPQRPTVLVAKQAIDVALFSKGRLRLGVGVGWNWVEYKALGQDFSARGRRLDEQIPLLRRLWSERLVTHHGPSEQIEHAGMVTRTDSPIPIWLGGFSEPAFRRAGRLGDGFLFQGAPNPDPEHWARVRHHLREVGRSEEGFGREFISRGPTLDARAMADVLKRGRDEGYTHASFETVRRGLTDVRAHIDFIAEVRQHLD